MAIRPVFAAGLNGRLCKPEYTEFPYFNGFAKSQKQKCVASLHASFLQEHPGRKVLEISSYSTEELGVRLSAFHLPLRLKSGKEVSVECAFQAGKIFERGGPYPDLLELDSRAAKKDARLKNSGKLVGFCFEGEEFPIVPRTVFYNWLYIHALHSQAELADAVMEYDSFTDIVFNPQKQSNCQAEAAAMYVALRRLGLLEEALKSREDFLLVGYITGSSGRLDTREMERAAEIRAREQEKLRQAASGEKNLRQEEEKDALSAKAGGPGKPTAAKAGFVRAFQPGDKIRHPKFNLGEVVEVTEKEGAAVLTIRFAVGEKKLQEEWVQKNCRKIEPE